MYFLGVDGGGTKTAAILFDTDTASVRSAVLGRGNILILGRPGCVDLLGRLGETLLAGLSPADVTAAAFAFAGAGRPAERTMAESVLAELGYRQFHVTTDARMLHYSFFADTPGILIAAGTGSVCLVTAPDGGFHQLGGWGYALGDEGSGFHIGRLALGHALDGMDAGCPRTKLTEALLQFYNADSPKAFVSRTYAEPSPQRFVASCAERVDALARQGDPDALAVINLAARALVNLAQTALTYYPKTDTGHVHIALAGGVLNSDTATTQRFKAYLAEQAMAVNYVTSQLTPAAAAVLYAAAHAGYGLSEQEKQRLCQINP